MNRRKGWEKGNPLQQNLRTAFSKQIKRITESIPETQTGSGNSRSLISGPHGARILVDQDFVRQRIILRQDIGFKGIAFVLYLS